MTTNKTAPSDAPFGPIVRFVRRLSIGDDMSSGGAFGNGISPRLEGWMKSTGIDTTNLSLWIDNATSWAIATPTDLHREAYARPKRQKKAALAPLFRALWEARSEDPGREHGKKWLCTEAASILAGNEGDDEAEAIARDVIAAHALGDTLPTAKTLEDWHIGASVEDMLTADGATLDDWDE